MTLSEAQRELRKHWPAFSDADPVPPDFIERMEAAGLVYLRRVASADLETPFAAELGIERGGYLWTLTDSGRRALGKPALHEGKG